MTGEPWITPDEIHSSLEKGDGEGVRIAILDSGIDTTHPGLASLDLGDDVAIVSEGGRIRITEGEGGAVFGHGTAVAGIIHQCAPKATLGSFRVLGHFKESRGAVIREGRQSRLPHRAVQLWSSRPRPRCRHVQRLDRCPLHERHSHRGRWI